MANFDLTGLALSMVCPTNKLITDDRGLPGVYVERAAQPLSALLAGGDSSIHPAFLINGIQHDKIAIGKFQAKTHSNRAYSLPGEDPTTYITFDASVQACKNKGDGHHLITAAEWAFLALLAKKNGTMPKGNNNYGKDASETLKIAIPTSKDNNGATCRVATGTGPATWSDTGDISGIYDLNGNIWEWVSGMRLVKGELQVIPYNNAADPECDTSAASTQWRAINAAATNYNDLFIAPNGQGTTAGSVKLDFVSNHWQWAVTITSQSDSSRNALFASTTALGLSDFTKKYMQAMALLPEDGATADDYAGDNFWGNNGADERLPSRGGSYWDDQSGAGVFALYLAVPRGHSAAGVGFRAALPSKPDTQSSRAVRQCRGDKGACFHAVQIGKKQNPHGSR